MKQKYSTGLRCMARSRQGRPMGASFLRDSGMVLESDGKRCSANQVTD